MFMYAHYPLISCVFKDVYCTLYERTVIKRLLLAVMALVTFIISKIHSADTI